MWKLTSYNREHFPGKEGNLYWLKYQTLTHFFFFVTSKHNNNNNKNLTEVLSTHENSSSKPFFFRVS